MAIRLITLLSIASFIFLPTSVYGKFYTLYFCEYGISMRVSDENIRLHGVLRHDTIFLTRHLPNWYHFKNSTKGDIDIYLMVENTAPTETPYTNSIPFVDINRNGNKCNENIEFTPTSNRNSEQSIVWYFAHFLYDSHRFTLCFYYRDTRDSAKTKICQNIVQSVQFNDKKRSSNTKFDDLLSAKAECFYKGKRRILIDGTIKHDTLFGVSLLVPKNAKFNQKSKSTNKIKNTRREKRSIIITFRNSAAEETSHKLSDTYYTFQNRPYWRDSIWLVDWKRFWCMYQLAGYHFINKGSTYLLFCEADYTFHPDCDLEFCEIAASVRFDDE